jgi:hypothetical protein
MEVRRPDGHLRHQPFNLDCLYKFYWRSFCFKTYESVRRDAGPPINSNASVEQNMESWLIYSKVNSLLGNSGTISAWYAISKDFRA